MTTLPQGIKLKCYGQLYGWYQVRYKDQRAWISSQFSQPLADSPSREENSCLLIRGVEVNPQGEETRIKVLANLPCQYKVNRWGNRLVVDIPNSLLVAPKESLTKEISNYPVDRVRLGQFDSTTVRLVCDLSGPADYSIEKSAQGLTLKVFRPSIKNKKIVIDPGHGTDPKGCDPGAIGPTGVKEKDVNLAISLKLAQLLRQAGAQVYLTREGEYCPYDLRGRATYANQVGADIFVSIHADASPNPSASGTTTYYCPIRQAEERRRLARCLQEALVAEAGRKDRGIREANFVVIKYTLMPSVLVETAFLSNPEEEQLLNTPSFQEKVARGLYRGIVNYFSGT